MQERKQQVQTLLKFLGYGILPLWVTFYFVWTGQRKENFSATLNDPILEPYSTILLIALFGFLLLFFYRCGKGKITKNHILLLGILTFLVWILRYSQAGQWISEMHVLLAYLLLGWLHWMLYLTSSQEVLLCKIYIAALVPAFLLILYFNSITMWSQLILVDALLILCTRQMTK